MEIRRKTIEKERLRQFEAIFNPKSIAVVGASGDKRKVGTQYLLNLLNSHFKGKLYAVDLVGGNFRGMKIYPNLSSIPECVDYLIIGIPRHSVPALLDECAAKKVKAMHMFTAGFSETGDEEGLRLEKEIVKKAREGRFRIIGPSSAGVYSPKVNMLLHPMDIEAGTAAFICQSGSLTFKGIHAGITCGLGFSKIVSIGNACDMDSTEFIEYFGIDPETGVIGAYLEGVRDGKRLLQIAKDISREKPIVMWKGGKTEAGARTAASHTGVLASPSLLWTAAMKQAGVIEVNSMDELIDTMLIFQHLPLLDGRRVTIISGVVDGGGGESVAAADICISSGLELPSFSDETKSQLESLLGKVGSIWHNPLDVSQAAGKLGVVHHAIEIAAADQHIDLIIIQERMEMLLLLLEQLGGSIENLIDMIVDIRRNQKKPVVVVLEGGLTQAKPSAMVRKLLEAQIPVFPKLERAAKAIANLCRYSEYRRLISANA